jgi:hypothetical protein
MALVLADRVRETSTTTGTGSVTLAGAYTGFQTFSAAIGNANDTYYTIANIATGEWEVGIGTYTSSGNILSRDTVLSSSNAGSLVVFSAGTKDVFVTQPAERAVYVNAANTQVSVPQLAATSITNSGTTTLSGNQIISVTDNTNAALRITQLGTGNALLVEDTTNPDSTPFVIDANGAVIVGYTAAVGTQNYGGLALANTLYQQHGSAQSTSTAAIFNWSSSAASPPNLIFNKSISNVIGTRGALTAANTDLGAVTFNGDDGTNFIPAAVILGEVDGTPSTNDMPGRLVFSTTADGASSPTERMRIDSSGNVGIGTSSPSAGLGVANWGTSSSPTLLKAFGTIPNTATGTAIVVDTIGTTLAASTPLVTLVHYRARPADTFGAGATLTNQYGYYADSRLTGATNNYGFYGNIASGTGRYNFYANGTAENFFGGNTVVSVTDNTNAALRITQLGTGNALLVEDDTNPDSSPFVIDANGNVISGYTASLTSLSGITPSLQVVGTSLNSSSIGAFNYTNSVNGAFLTFAKSRSGAIGTETVVQSGDNLLTIRAYGSDGVAPIQAAQIRVEVDGTPGTDDMPGRLVFSTTADGASTPTERMRIDSAGDVGIGTTTPVTRLEIAGNNTTNFSSTASSISGTTLTVGGSISGTLAVGSAVFAARMQPYTRITALGTGTGGAGTYTVNISQTFASAAISGSATDSGTVIRITELDTSQAAGQPTGGLQFYTSDNSPPTAGVGAYVAAVAEDTSPDTALVFGTRDDNGGGIDANERMRITSAGNVGIGTDIPNANLEISNAGNVVLRLTAGNTSSSVIQLGDTDDGNVGEITYSHSTNSMAFDTNDVERLRIDSSGNVGIGTTSPACVLDVVGGIQTSRTAVTSPAATDGNVFSGTYTPTLTNTTNITSSTASGCQYMRVGNVVTVSGQVAVTPTATGNTLLGISLPIASNFTGAQQLGGTAMAQTTTQGAILYGDATNDRVVFRLQAAATTALTYAFSFTYQVL